MIDITTVSWGDLGWIITAFIMSMWLLTSALTGMEKFRLNTIERILRSMTGVFVLFPSLTISGSALIAGLLLIVAHRLYFNKGTD